MTGEAEGGVPSKDIMSRGGEGPGRGPEAHLEVSIEERGVVSETALREVAKGEEERVGEMGDKGEGGATEGID